MFKRFTKIQEQQFCDEYNSNERPSCRDLAKKHNCSAGTISNVIKRNGYKLRTNSESHKGQKSNIH